MLFLARQRHFPAGGGNDRLGQHVLSAAAHERFPHGIYIEPFEVHADMVADAIRAADATARVWKKHNGEARSK